MTFNHGNTLKTFQRYLKKCHYFYLGATLIPLISITNSPHEYNCFIVNQLRT